MPVNAGGEAMFAADAVERIARVIHERYRSHQRGRKPPGDPALEPWETLAEPLRNSNRAQAADIGIKLRAVRCSVVPVDGTAAGFQFAPEEIERLAIMEHDRWVAERRAAGWTLGPARDVERKLSPHLVPWEDLAEEFREYDREAVRVIPEILADAGLAIRRHQDL
jgi:hypothetical protein